MNASHIAIPAILKIEEGALGQIGKYLKDNGFSNVVIYFGNDLIDLFGSLVMESLAKAEVNVLEYREIDSVVVEDVMNLAFSMPAKTQAVVGIGGGKVIDAAKYAGFLKKVPFISVPTSSSSDGFSSASASLIVNGRRCSLPAKLAYGIVVDTKVVESAPEKFIYSGVGDLVSKITALYDWQYEEDYGYADVNDFAMMIAKKAVNSFVRTEYESIHDPLFLRELLQSLAMCGIANEIAGSSAPTSGSEHLISHALDQSTEHPQLHGVQVGIATYIMAVVQEHRVKRIDKVFLDSGFWKYVASLNLSADAYEEAIKKAPEVKPFRHTYLHEEKYRQRAIEVLHDDSRMKEVFHN